MAKKSVKKKVKVMKCKMPSCCNGGGAYFLGFLGAAVYYITTASGFFDGVLGVLKALVWPAFVVFEVLSFVVA